MREKRPIDPEKILEVLRTMVRDEAVISEPTTYRFGNRHVQYMIRKTENGSWMIDGMKHKFTSARSAMIFLKTL